VVGDVVLGVGAAAPGEEGRLLSGRGRGDGESRAAGPDGRWGAKRAEGILGLPGQGQSKRSVVPTDREGGSKWRQSRWWSQLGGGGRIAGAMSQLGISRWER
jgi:hypothetical protein